MLVLQKVVVFLFVILLLFYMIKLSVFTKKRWEFRTCTFIVLILGLILFTIATLIDALGSFLPHSQIGYFIVKSCFTAGVVIYVAGMILWSNYTKTTIEKFEKIASTDCMTGVLNRKGIEKIFELISEKGEPFYMIICDLDGTKLINDTYGHLVGDKYITNASEIIENIIGIKGHFARIGGDEFVILLKEVQFAELRKIILKIKKLVDQVSIEKNTGISLGYSLFPKDGTTFEELVKVADKMMYEDKKRSKSLFI